MRARSFLAFAGFAVGLGLTVVGNPRLASATAPPALDDPHIVAVGTQLVAVNDVTLRDASISKGARVNVTKVVERRGRIATLDVELSDGHVVRRVSIDTIRAAFTVAADP